MSSKDDFIRIYTENIKRTGADSLLSFLQSESCDFFTAPASTRFHGSHEGGLAEHCLNVYSCLKDYLERSRVKELYQMNYSDETIAVVTLLHDFCKINTYVTGKRNVKDAAGIWQSVPTYEFRDNFPFGHGEKSVFLINRHMRLTDDEAFAIRFHMGFTCTDETRLVSEAFKMYPLAFALSTADMEATFLMEKDK
ncbi:MAG: hydrolase [Saccharofermentanales bacterium]